MPAHGPTRVAGKEAVGWLADGVGVRREEVGCGWRAEE
jgi:hypothetical protein